MSNTGYPGIYARETRKGTVFDAMASVDGRQRQKRGLPTIREALKAQDDMREEMRPGAERVIIATHGQSRTATYQAWANMIQRCSNPKHPFFAHYGGRGITVCVRWRRFESFLADMGEKPPRLTLERIDNDGNYEPSNCKWATMSEQVRNRRAARLQR